MGLFEPEMLTAASRRRVLRLASAVAVVWLASGVQARADTLKIVPLVRDGQVLVSCHLSDAYTADLREVIQSGLRTTFTYTVELRLKVPMWVDRIVEAAVVTTTVQYDNLTRRHSVSRLLDGRVEDAKVTDDEAAVREWLTAFDKLPLFRTTRLEPNRESLRRGARRGPTGQRRAVLALGLDRVGPDEVHLHPVSDGQAASRGDSRGSLTGHSIPIAGSFHAMPASCSGAYSLVNRYITSAVSLSTQKP